VGVLAIADPREELWKASFDTYYDSLFEELVADALITRWAYVDDLTKVLVMITASGSAVSGWALWNHPGYRLFWLLLSGAAALLSILHTSLGIPNRIRAHGEDKRRFAGLRTELETFRYRMKVRQDGFDVEQFMSEFLEYRKRYSENVQLLCNEIARTSRFELAMQAEVDARLQSEIANEEEYHE
jgi:hypothetical protein